MGNVVKISHKIIRCISLLYYPLYTISRANSILTKRFKKIRNSTGVVRCFL